MGTSKSLGKTELKVQGASTVAQRFKLLLVAPASHSTMLVPVPVAPLPTRFLLMQLEVETDSPSTWVPATHVEDLD